MLQSIPRRLLLRGTRIPKTACKTIVIPQSQQPSFTTSRKLAKNDDSSKKPPLSDYITSQPPSSNPETPVNKIPDQTDESIAPDRIFHPEEQLATDGTPRDTVPVEDVVKETPGGVDSASKVMKNKITSDLNSLHATHESGLPPEEEKGEMGNVTGETMASESIISRGENEGNGPKEGIPVEEVMSSKDAIDDVRSAPRGTPAHEPDLTESPQSSIIDLFGPESQSYFPKGKSQDPVQQIQDNKEPVDPLSELKDGLSPWDHRPQDLPQQIPTDPDEWATTDRGQWDQDQPEASAPRLSEEDLLIQRIRERFSKLPRPKENIPPLIRTVNQAEPRPITPWDYFYPPPAPHAPLSSVKRQLAQKDKGRVKAVSEANSYDPFKTAESVMKWPWLYNRDSFVSLLVNHLMQDGKKATAEKILQQVLLKLVEKYPLQHPVTVLAEAVFKNAPLVKVNNVKQGIKVIETPYPLNEKQRIRKGWKNMIAAAGSTNERGRHVKLDRKTLREPFAERLAREVVKVMEGTGAGLKRNQEWHSSALQFRLNVKVGRT
jgi:ribosomal protein S7